MMQQTSMGGRGPPGGGGGYDRGPPPGGGGGYPPRDFDRGGGGGYDRGPPGGGGGGQRGGSWNTRASDAFAEGPRNARFELDIFGPPRDLDVKTTGINFDKYDDIPVETSGRDVPVPAKNFESLGMPAVLLQNVSLAGYDKPTPIQKNTVPMAIAGRDLMACAQTGSGKTASFLLPIVTRIVSMDKPAPSRKASPMALILSPTRELTIQIYNEGRKFCYLSGVRPVVCYGAPPHSNPGITPVPVWARRHPQQPPTC